MAAEFLLTFAAEGILTKVSSLASQELTLAWGFKAELKKLGNSLSIIQDFLHGAADQKPQDHQGKAVEEWVKKLKDIAHEADDVLDDFNYEVLRRKVELQNHMKRKVLNFLSASNPLLFRLKMAHKIKKINDSLVELKNEAAFINLVAKRRDSSPGGEQLDRDQTDPFFEKDEKVVGREDVVSKIVESLTNSNNPQDLSVMAIVGMAGLGKTTLAKSVYNEPAIDTHFHKKIWVCVSNTFDVDVILSQMLESLTRHIAGMKNRSPLIDSLKDELTGKKYVLILDDVWSEHRSKWESLMSCLSKLNSTPGSSIIITTRSANVASIAETLPRPKLRNLSNDECWSILKQRALNLKVNDVIDADRERIGRAIAEKCGGIPLVAKVLGSIMRSKTSRDEWLAIQNSEIWDLPEEDDRIMSVLKLSFNNLKTSPLKQCFAYCSMLKKDFEIERDNLIQLWMAQGLLQPSTEKNHHEMEDTGKKYFYTLLKNSLFQEVTEGGTITKYTMHDLVHDLAEEVSKSESLTQDLNDTCEVRHVARIRPSTLENMSEVTVRRLQSLFSNDQVSDIIFSKFRALRILNLHRANIQELPISFGKLKHLRYLDVSYSRIKALPKSIGKLYNLQTLRMQETDYLNEVPREMQNLINLRHLYFDKTMEFPAGLLRGLTNLRTLSYFNVGKEMGVGIEELVDLNHLKGELIIRNLENIRDEEEAKKAKLEDKKNVLELSYVWARSRSNPEGLESRPSSNINDENVLEGLKPHTKLESLSIENFMGDKFPSWMMRNPLPLNNLKKVLLFGCSKCEELPILGHLPDLGHVEIYEMHNLKRLGSEFYGYNPRVATREKETTVLFPALKTLSIVGCDELTEWMEAPTSMTSSTTRKVVVFPCLEKLTLGGCPLLRNAPSHFPSLKELSIWGMDSEKPMASICNEVSTLTSLDIGNIKGLTSLSSEMLKKNKNLTSLKIRSCDEMIRIAPNVFGCCANLRELTIQYCKKLEHLAEGLDTLPLLEKLTIRQCPTLEFIPIDRDMASLRELEIKDCDGLSSIGLLDHCTSLQKLEIYRCRNLTSIPISQGLASLRRLDIWKCDGLSSIGILDHCTSLQELEIWGCENLTSIPISQGLASLRKLDIRECGGLTGLPCRIENCPSLQTFCVLECPKLVSISFSTDLNPRLQELSLDCNGLPNLPDFRSFTSLRVLNIYNCGGIPSGIENCTSLQELMISGCSSLETISFTRVVPSLRKLSVSECPKLASISFSTDLNPCLKELRIDDCNGLQSLPDLRSFTSLLVLEIGKCAGIESLVCGFHIPVSLEELRISQCHNLESIPSLDECTSLRQLGVRDCEKLKSLSTGLRCLARLEELDLGPFWEELDSFPDFQAPSQQLGRLALGGWPKLKSLPQQVQHFTSLTWLTIRSFNGVEALPEWLGNLASLKHLTISDCENIKYLPSLKAMQRLTKLYSLQIYRCPLLKERCTEDSGEEWPKICHIPNVYLPDD
ncbi:putative disease resistance protein RGA3 [Rosa rugosa]|uniref:putative disease resistance protein RGA3 n=1 Tax=Rosa rugosa TaxID=74645 RepID=UPI002B4057B8|nr:putative disease resistance protein RGA3 [Rosa rugosa]XP_061990389.1 putative disease resistance protein RGA3 [Rosa rugosa]XP_061990390.1 putative disease resistance protein RGA3 [Rosa rugosa]XP_061990391.1 putative disease resistance protein RGA3 [Rosa rugosa]XP_061990392.1 putative disease resistance protein RGA3 [Rosa rugosa]XP_061990394.1 putative disease resistance protein RGA3 [Rosa rugosa]XP_061990395.1 putative disease resistance protein RGA3 [Rosa rugosa]